MNAFDIASALVLLVSAVIGFSRGAVREVVSLAALALAALAAVYLLPLSGPLALHLVHPRWAAKAVAVAAVFLAVYLIVRIAGASLSAALRRQATLGTLDRAGGLGLGLVRGLAVLGGFWLAVSAATPQVLAAPWVSHSLMYPLSRACGRALAAAAPGGLRAAGGFGRVLTDHIAEGGSQGDESNDNQTLAPAPPVGGDRAPYAGRSGRRLHRQAPLAVVTGDPVQE